MYVELHLNDSDVGTNFINEQLSILASTLVALAEVNSTLFLKLSKKLSQASSVRRFLLIRPFLVAAYTETIYLAE